MTKFLPLHLILPLLTPMVLAGLFVEFGGGPLAGDMVKDLESPDPEKRNDALDWLIPVRRPSLLEHVHPLLFDPDQDVAEEATEVIHETSSMKSLEPLDRAWEETDIERERLLLAYAKIRFPRTLPYIEKHFDHPDPEVREIAREAARGIRLAINHEIVYFSLGTPIYNKMDYLIYSQAMLFPEGREMVEGTSTEPEEGTATP